MSFLDFLAPVPVYLCVSLFLYRHVCGWLAGERYGFLCIYSAAIVFFFVFLLFLTVYFAFLDICLCVGLYIFRLHFCGSVWLSAGFPLWVSECLNYVSASQSQRFDCWLVYMYTTVLRPFLCSPGCLCACYFFVGQPACLLFLPGLLAWLAGLANWLFLCIIIIM